jgi:hypothetical protein
MDLPTEIWQMIYGVIRDNKTLSCLSRTCRFLRELGIPLLYKRFQTFDCTDGHSYYQSLSGFIWAISQNRELAKIVTEMYATFRYSASDVRYYTLAPHCLSAITHIMTTVVRHGDTVLITCLSCLFIQAYIKYFSPKSRVTNLFGVGAV